MPLAGSSSGGAGVVVALHRPPGLALADRNGSVMRRLELAGGARHLALARSGGPVLVPDESGDRLLSADLPDGRVSSSVGVGNHPHDVAVVGGRYFVSDEFADTVS